MNSYCCCCCCWLVVVAAASAASLSVSFCCDTNNKCRTTADNPLRPVSAGMAMGAVGTILVAGIVPLLWTAAAAAACRVIRIACMSSSSLPLLLLLDDDDDDVCAVFVMVLVMIVCSRSWRLLLEFWMFVRWLGWMICWRFCWVAWRIFYANTSSNQRCSRCTPDGMYSRV